jgi:ERI1 exoribonuclease 3
MFDRITIFVPGSPLYSDCASHFKKWLNIKNAFKRFTESKAGGMIKMMTKFNLKLEGKHHSGIDDCHNIGRIVTAMASRGWKLNPKDITF